MFSFLSKIKQVLGEKKTLKGILLVSFILFLLLAPNISRAWSLFDVTYGFISKIFFGISYFIALLGGLVVAVLIIGLQMILQVSTGIVNSTPVQIGFPIVLSIANLGFVLAVIVIAVATILRQEGYGVKKLLANVIIMAVMVNFGLVISGAIIGFSNRITTYFLDSMTGGVTDFASIMAGTMNPQAAFSWAQPPEFGDTDQATSTVVKNAGDTATQSQLGKAATGGGSFGAMLIPVFQVFLTIVTVVIMIVTLAVLFVSFVLRYIKITFYLILLPAAWMASIFPGLKSWSGKWWNAFISQVFYPPVVIFFLWLAMRVQTGMSSTDALKVEVVKTGGGGITDFLGNVLATPLQAILQAVVIAGIMLGGDYAGKAIGVASAGAATKTATSMKGWASGKVKRAGTRAGTRALGSGLAQGTAKGVGNLGAKMSNVGLSGKGGKFRQAAGKIFGAPVRGIGGLAVAGQAGMKGGEKALSEQAGKSYRDDFAKMGDDELLIRAKAATGLERAAILDKASKDPKLMAKLMNVPGFKDGVSKNVVAEKDLYTRYGFKDAREGALVQSGYALKQAAEYESLGLEKQRDDAKEKGDTAKVEEIEKKIKDEKAKLEFTNTKDVVSKMSKETIASFLSPDPKNLPAGLEGDELKNAQTAIVSGLVKGSVSKFTSVIQELESKDKLKDFASAVDVSGITENEIGKGYKNSIEKGALAGITSYEELFKPAIEKGPRPSQWKGMNKEQIASKIRKENPSLGEKEILQKVTDAENEAGS